MKNNLTLLSIFGLALLLSIVCCNPKSSTTDKPANVQLMNEFSALMQDGLNASSMPENTQKAIDKMREALPGLSENDKAELNSIIAYLDDKKTKLPNYLDDDDNHIEFLRVVMTLADLLARSAPNDFETNSKVASSYLIIATSVTSDFNSEKMNAFRDECNERSVQAGKALVEKFPDNPMSYGQLAHITFYTGGSENEAVNLLNKCLELDKNSEYCNNFLNTLKNG